MAQAQIESLTDYDTLCLTAHEFDAPLSCAMRLAREARQGNKTLVAVLFDDGMERDSASAALSLLGIDQVRLRLPSAAQRSRCYASYVARMFGQEKHDESQMIDRLWPILDGLRLQTRARHVYLPLGTGEVDHRLVQEVGFRIFDVGSMRNVLLYEERPYSFAPGAIHMRLAQLGSRLPPALTDIGDTNNLIRVIWGALAATHVRHNVRGIGSRVLYVWRSASAWRRARGWQPRKAFGLRVQPIFHEASFETEEAVRLALESVTRAARGRLGSIAHIHKQVRQYSKRLGRTMPIERYWLMLPQRDSDGVMSPMSEIDFHGSEANLSTAPRPANAQDPEATEC